MGDRSPQSTPAVESSSVDTAGAELRARVERLEEYEHAYKTLVFESSRPVLIFNPDDGRVLEANPAALRVLGWSRDEITAMDVVALSAGANGPRILEQVRAGRDRPRHFEWHACARPEPLWFDVATLPLRIDRRAVVFTLLTDATARHSLAAQAREIVDRHLWLLEISPDAVVISIRGRIEYANPAALALFGAATSEQLLQRTIFDVVAPEFHDSLRVRLTESMQLGQQSGRFEHRIVRIDGSTCECESVAVTVSYRGQIARQTILRDTSVQRAREAELRASERRYKAVTDSVADTVFEIEDAGNDRVRLLWCTPSYQRATGFEPGRVISITDGARIVGPENTDALLALQRAAFRGEAVTTEFQIGGPEGTVVIIGLRPSAPEVLGAAPRAVGFGRQVTAERHAEAARALSEERYRAIAAATSDFVYEYLLTADGDMDVVWMSDAGQSAFQLRAGDKIPLERWLQVVHEEDVPTVRARVPRLRAGETCEYEFHFRSRAGGSRCLRATDRPVGELRPDGRMRVIGAAKDVTSLRDAQERHAALEVELRRAREQLERSLLSHLEFGAKPRTLVRHGAERDASRHNHFGTSPAMRQAHELAQIAAAHDAPVLITGETGTGKGHLAQWIHDSGPLHDRPFVGLNCSTLHGDLLTSELFGHARGAFTSAVRDRRGLIDEADGGTLFLDEISEMDLPAQAQLLKVIEEKTYRRVGDTTMRRSSFRLVCATNRDLLRAVRDGRFREDLYFRVNVFPIALPALRERREDLPGLITHLLRSLEIPAERLAKHTVAFLVRYDWPGNIRELRNALIRARLLAGDGPILPSHFPGLEPAMAPDDARLDAAALTIDRDGFLTRYRELSARYGGNRSQIARAMGVSRMTLYRYLQRFGDAQ